MRKNPKKEIGGRGPRWLKLFPSFADATDREGRLHTRLIFQDKIRYGTRILVLDDPHAKIQPGDTYIAGRWTGPKLLKCKDVRLAWVYPIAGYVFDVSECRRVKEVLRA